MSYGLHVLNIGIRAPKLSIKAGSPTISITAAADIYWDSTNNSCCDNPIFNVVSTAAWAYSGGDAKWTVSPSSGSAGTTQVTISYVANLATEDSILTFYIVGSPAINATTHQWGFNGCA
jgi:hypothetical protein